MTRERDRPWLFRTYAGHTSAVETNALFRTNLSRGQTGLSVAFDLPTQTGYDSDHPLARGEVGKVGVPVRHLGDMRVLFEGIALDKMNTSMTINAPAAWLLALYAALAAERGCALARLAGTVQNDIIKEYLSRGTYIFPPDAGLRLTTDVISFCAREMPKWNPVNICSYHLREAGADPADEVAFTLSAAVAVLDAVRAGGRVPERDFPRIVGKTSFFLNSGIRLVTELSKMRAFTELWDEIARDRYGVDDPRLRRFRYGVQVNSLALTEQQPENNVYRILLEMLPVVLSKNSRARAVQLPAWNEALGLPRPWDQQWSLRLQQIVAFETDLLEFGDIFEGSRIIAETTEALKNLARDEMARIEAMGGAVPAVKNGYMKQKLVSAGAENVSQIESGERTVVGVNAFRDCEPSPLTANENDASLSVSPDTEDERIGELKSWRETRDQARVDTALGELDAAARGGTNIMEPSISCAKAGVTTGEWAGVLRRVFGEYRAPTGIMGAAPLGTGEADNFKGLHRRVLDLTEKLGRRPKLLIGKPGLDGHSNGAEQIAVRARNAGFEVVYEGIRLTPAEIARTALEEGVHLVGLSVLSGSHLALAGDVLDEMKKADIADIPVVIGGIVPPKDIKALSKAGIARVYTPKDFGLTAILDGIATLIGETAET